MNVAELIEALKKFDPTTNVYTIYEGNEFEKVKILRVLEVDKSYLVKDDLDPNDKFVIVID